MMLIGVPDDLVRKLMEVSNGLGKPISDYVNEVLEQGIRAHELNCSLEKTVDLYERTIMKKEVAEEAKRVEEPLVPEVFETLLASKMRAQPSNSEERKMLSRFLSELSMSARTERNNVDR